MRCDHDHDHGHDHDHDHGPPARQEKVVLHLQHLAAARIQQVTLARGWSSWLGRYHEALRRRSLLQSCAARLSKPLLSYSLAR